MRPIIKSAAVAALIALSSPTLANAQNLPPALQGLMNGNRDQDRAVRDAYERGYQKGREDEARLARGNHRGDDDRRRTDDNYGRPPPQAPYTPYNR